MKMSYRLLWLPVLLLMFFSRGVSRVAMAQRVADDTVQISLLTCAPGAEIYEAYGHTALRVNSLARPDDDYAYNFGWFSFSEPHFAWRFILGKTAYTMAQQSFPLFVTDYASQGRRVTEQRLALTPQEALRVRRGLLDTLAVAGYEERAYRQGNFGVWYTRKARWRYHYSFLYDNCTTRAVRAITDAIKAEGGHLEWPSLQGSAQQLTQRAMLHDYTAASPWGDFGQNLMLAAETDKIYTALEMAQLSFLPYYALDYFDKALVCRADGSRRPLVAETVEIPMIAPMVELPTPSPITPVVAAVVLLAVAIVLTWQERRRRWMRLAFAFDLLTMTLRGLVGCLLLILVLWSLHPGVHHNWLLLIMSPLPLVGIAVKCVLRRRGCDHYNYLPAVAALLLLAAIVAGVQRVPTPIIFVACTLLVRAYQPYALSRKV